MTRLDIDTLLYNCSRQPIFNHVCDNDSFWKARTQKDFKNLPILTETNWKKKQYMTDIVKYCKSLAVISTMKQVRVADEHTQLLRVCQRCGTKELI